MERPNIINYSALWDRIGKYARTAGRITTRPVLLLYYVMGSDETPWKDKLTIFGALAYLVFPVDLLDAKRLPIIGWLDEITSLAVAIQRMSKYITPGMEVRADAQLNEWFGAVESAEESMQS